MNTTTTSNEVGLMRFSDNVPGPWYVNEECIECGICAQTAPENFRLSDDGDHNIVFKQPETSEEIEQSEEAIEACPVEAIVRLE